MKRPEKPRQLGMQRESRTRRLTVAVAAGALVASVVAAGHPSAAQPDAQEASVGAHFDQQIATSSNLMFGLSSWPKIDPRYAEQVADSGVTIARSDVYLYDIIPSREVFEKDPADWNWHPEKPTETTNDDDIDAFNDQGVQRMLIIHGFPEWMGTEGQTPTWDGFDDSLPVTDHEALGEAYKQVFAHYLDKTDYFEIANEPDFAMEYEDYADIYKSALAGMNQVSTDKPVGPQIGDSEPEWFERLLADPEIGPDIDFADWHSYGDDWSANAGAYRDVSAAAGREDMPLFVTEWNWSPSFEDDDPLNRDSPEAISYAGMKLSGMMDAGVHGAMLFGSNDAPDSFDAELRPPFAFIDSEGNLAPKSAAFRLLSTSLGLGTGENRIMHTTDSGVSASCSAINADGQRVAWAINDTGQTVTSSLTLESTGASGDVSLAHYVASEDNDAAEPTDTETLSVDPDGRVDTTLTLPPHSIHGVVLDN
ncbi:hypothetical protein DSC45_21735 [Streptomyces sp. YIM 130001]|uniref:hypothetical protein n=1 Tax=Streptomyces sp. YIM 130001 TaxID=2259644 RepID=UPI000EEB69AD|nr:hypothetical protein [Streptomyces sp. YIM 130001]RII13926.1 hypothetical protein DSC45_21735 [Streptomyces sp. YIM 130001]